MPSGQDSLRMVVQNSGIPDDLMTNFEMIEVTVPNDDSNLEQNSESEDSSDEEEKTTEIQVTETEHFVQVNDKLNSIDPRCFLSLKMDSNKHILTTVGGESVYMKAVLEELMTHMRDIREQRQQFKNQQSNIQQVGESMGEDEATASEDESDTDGTTLVTGSVITDDQMTILTVRQAPTPVAKETPTLDEMASVDHKTHHMGKRPASQDSHSSAKRSKALAPKNIDGEGKKASCSNGSKEDQSEETNDATHSNQQRAKSFETDSTATGDKKVH